jgi:hypothetical protein
MARVTRSSILLWMQDLLGFQAGANQVPVDTPNSIQPVIEVGPRFCQLIRASSRGTTGSSTIYTTPADKDFYITHAVLTLTKDATNDGTSLTLSASQGGLFSNILNIRTQTTTAGSFSQVISFPYPIKVDRNSAISYGMTFTAGSATFAANIGGFIIE